MFPWNTNLVGLLGILMIAYLGGGFKYCVFSPLPGEMIQFDERAYFSNGLVKNHQLDLFFFGKNLENHR